MQYGHTHIVQLFLKSGAEVNTRFSSSKTCLHQACYDGNQEITELLVEAGTNISTRSVLGDLFFVLCSSYSLVVQEPR